MPDVVPQNTGGVGGEGIRAVAIYDYQAADDDELSFDPDDMIYDIEKVNNITLSPSFLCILSKISREL